MDPQDPATTLQIFKHLKMTSEFSSFSTVLVRHLSCQFPRSHEEVLSFTSAQLFWSIQVPSVADKISLKSLVEWPQLHTKIRKYLPFKNPKIQILILLFIDDKKTSNSKPFGFLAFLDGNY
jgi:hypothetical protein